MTEDSSLNSSQEALLRGDWKTALAHLPMPYDVLNDATMLKHLCCAYLQAGRWEDVSRISASAAQRFCHEPIFWECWAWAEHKQAESATALRILEFVARRFARREGVVYSMACLYAANNRLGEARRWLVRAQKLSRDRGSFASKVARQRELAVLWTHERAFAT